MIYKKNKIHEIHIIIENVESIIPLIVFVNMQTNIKIIVTKNIIKKAIDIHIMNLPRLIIPLTDNLRPIKLAIKNAKPPIAKIKIKY